MAGWVSDSWNRLVKNAKHLSRSVCGYSSSKSHAQIAELQKDLESVERTLEKIKAVLADAEEREVRDNSVRLWLSELQDLAYEADDLLDLYEYELAAMEAQNQERAVEVLTGVRKRKSVDADLCISKASASPLENPSFRLHVVEGVKKIKDRFDEIHRMKIDLDLKENEGVRMDREIANWQHTGSFPVEEHIFGRESDLLEVVKMLINNSDPCVQIPRVVTLLGMGGVGKTTLAQHAFNNPEVGNYFDIKGWVYVSEDFELVSLTRKILQAFSKESCDLTELSLLQEQLTEQVEGKIFLLVMDDVWNESRTQWGRFLSSCLRHGAVGSKILITTRNQQVAEAAETTELFEINCLSDEEGWSLFSHCAFRDPCSSENHLELVQIGREIANKCKGLPLALKVIGCHLSYELEDRNTWQYMLEDELWDSDMLEDGKQILGPLLLSYDHLPPQLKPCLKICNVFPKGFQILKEELVSLWMAHDLIVVKDRDSWMDLQEVGMRYADNLISSSFLQIFDGDLFFRSFISADECYLTMHDLIHDLVQFLSKDESVETTTEGEGGGQRSLFLGTHALTSNYGNLRRLRALYCDFGKELKDCLLISKHLRSLKVNLFEGMKINVQQICTLYNLRELHLEDGVNRMPHLSKSTRQPQLPNSIGNLKHLLKLSVGFPWINNIPESIGRLTKLQSLHLSCLPDPDMLPKSILKLTSLQEIYVSGTCHSIYLPAGFKQMRNTRILGKYFCVGYCSEHAGITELSDLANLQGTLLIKELGNVRRSEDAKQANLMNKKNLQELELSWESWDQKQGECQSSFWQKEELVLESLKPHPNLQFLSVHFWRGAKLPSWLREDPPHLTKLISLSFEFCDNLVLLRLVHMPRLEHLRICSCPVNSIPVNSFLLTLRRLQLISCSNLTSISLYMLTALEYLVVSGCKKLELIEFSGQLDPSIAFTSSQLKQVQLQWCESLIEISPNNQTALQSLEVESCKKLKVITFSGPSARGHPLKTLRLVDCPMLQDVQLPEWVEFEHFEILGCPLLEVSDLEEDCPEMEEDRLG